MPIEQASKRTQHVVAIPYPAQGHITPMLQLCRQLVPFGFSFTFIITHHIHQRVQHARQRYQPNDGVQPDDPIRMLSVAGGLPPEYHTHRSRDRWAKLSNAVQEMQQPVEELITQFMRSEQGVAFVLSDVLVRWCGTTARKFRLPQVCFWPASAATCSALFYCSDLAAEGKCLQFTEDKDKGQGGIVEGIPGLPPTHTQDIPKVWDSSTQKVEHAMVDSFAAAKEAGWLLLNTFEEIEGHVIEALRKRMPTVALGPLLPANYMFHTCPDVAQEKPGLSLFPEDGRCLAWLDSQAPASVIFISFGSISVRSEAQLQELAVGVRASGCPFLWVRRPDILSNFTQDKSPLDNNMECHGLIVPWAPQLQVLAHPSVGGFITHCGWNSIIESLSMGVPMLCWADTGERMSNQRFVVEFWKCGVPMVAHKKRVTKHRGARLVGRDDVEKTVKFLMLDNAGAPIRARAAQLKGIARRAFQDSQTHLQTFVLNVDKKQRPPTEYKIAAKM